MKFRRPDPRVAQRHAQSLTHQQRQPPPKERPDSMEASVDLDWGQLIFAHTYTDAAELARQLQDEPHGRRNIAIYARDPHVILAQNPQYLFLDPSHTFRLWLSQYRAPQLRERGYLIRRMRTLEDAQAIARIYNARHMVPVDASFLWRNRASRRISYIVAEDLATGQVIGTTTGVDHVKAFGDSEGGSSLWCLAVDPDATVPGVGQALVRYLAEHFQARGRAFMDLSVMHDNRQAIALYEKLGFQRVPVFAVKTKNTINEKLFAGPPVEENLNPYAMLLVNEARRRGIGVEVLDAEGGFFRLIHGGRSIICRESLSELTTAVAMSRCDDKAVTRRLLEKEGLRVPAQRTAGDTEADIAFLRAAARPFYHPAGTCRMGRDARAVVAPDLTVNGAEGLWVADVSIFPRHIAGNANATALMIGEKAADLIGSTL